MSAILRSLYKISENEYVVAERKRGLGVLFLFLIIFGFFYLFVGILCLFFSLLDYEVIAMGISGLICFIVGICESVRYFKVRKIAITFKKGNFYIGKKIKCSPIKLGDISVKLAGQHTNRTYKYGTLYFSANGEKHSLSYIADVEIAQEIIVKIKSEYTQYIYQKKKREILEKTQLAEARQQEPVTQTEQQTAEPAPPEQIIQIEEPERTEQFEEFEETEQAEQEQTFEQPQFAEIADKIELPDLPD